MKPVTKITASFLFLCMIVIAASSQQHKRAAPPWVSDKGYWNAESNIHDPLHHIIRFYSSDGRLFHTEELSGIRLNIDKRKTKMKLKKALEQTMELYSRKETPQQISGYLVAHLK